MSPVTLPEAKRVWAYVVQVYVDGGLRPVAQFQCVTREGAERLEATLRHRAEVQGTRHTFRVQEVTL